MSTDRFVGGLRNLDGSLTADSDLSAGDAVTISSDNGVDHVSNNGDAADGVVMYDVSSGDPVTVAMAGAKVRVNANSSAGTGAAAAQTDGNVDDATSTDAAIGSIIEAEDGGDAIMLIAPGYGAEVN
jgi:hypothetical protein